MCVVAVKWFEKFGWCGAKNRDRNYETTIKIIQSDRNDVQRLYIDDTVSRWTEGLNEFGVCILSASFSVKSDEKEGDKVVPKGGKKKYNQTDYYSPDGKTIRDALYLKTPLEAIKHLQEQELCGATYVFNKDECYLLEGGFTVKKKHANEDNPREFISEIVEITKEVGWSVRTNHGIILPHLGYSKNAIDPIFKRARASTEHRLMYVIACVPDAKNPKDLIDCLAITPNEEDQFMNPIRKGDPAKGDMVTTGQLLLTSHDRTLHYRPIYSSIEFSYHKVNHPEAKTFFEIISSRKLLQFREWTGVKEDTSNPNIASRDVAGFNITIENPKGSLRSGTNSNGDEWSVPMPADYGFLKRIPGVDGDDLDCYVGDSNDAANVYVVDQLNVDTGEFDEHKIMIAFGDLQSARETYLNGFSDDLAHHRLGAITPLSITDFKNWLADGQADRPLAKVVVKESNTIYEGPSGRSLTIFDIDDTLFHTTAKVRVMRGPVVVHTLTSSEFNHYTLKPEESFDFGEFKNAEKFRKESEPIRPMLAKLKAILKNSGDSTVIMLTARADFDDKHVFLQTFKDYGVDMSKVHVHRAGNLPGPGVLPPQRKNVIVRQYLATGKYDLVREYDDSMANLKAFAGLKKEYPDVTFEPYLVDEHGGTKLIKLGMNESGEIVQEDWKSLAAAGLLGLSTVTGMAAHKPAAYAPAITHAVKPMNATSPEQVLMSYENSKSNPAGGYDKASGRWYPHNSLEGGSDTIAYGHKLQPGENFSKGLTDSEAVALLKKDIAKREVAIQQALPSYHTLPQYVKNAIVSAWYRGDLGPKATPKTMALMKAGDWANAAVQYLNHHDFKSGFAGVKKRMQDNADAFAQYAKEK